MAVLSLTGFKTEPGRLADHLAASEEAIGHLRRMGFAAIAVQPIAGTDIGTIATSINYENNAAYAAGMQTIVADEAFAEFWARAAAGAAAVQVESSLFSDVDASFQPDPNRPLGAILATQWRARPGRMNDFVGNVIDSMPHIERMGGKARAMQSLIGSHPLTMMVTTTFPDLDAYGAYADKNATDEQWQAFWSGVMSDPTADLIRSGLYVNLSD